MGNRKNKRVKKPRTRKKKQTDVEMEVAEEQFLEDVNLNGESEEQACEEAKDTEEEADRCRNGGYRREISRRRNEQRSLI
ncbi:hypothetical protein F2Q70_00003687 [Brassica cretica]|uniref:Uncharacterized protein n=1 Tax=Brassica cretica TaxID=69181 RepID=A0A8S9IMX7_BRACR|nr:hypothetical protein F2Q70_00003687 [Brassica cretica]